MKTLSIKQPWAWAIIVGGKDIENRTWNTSFRGRFLVHASKQFDHNAPKELKDAYFISTSFGQKCDGGIIGSVELTDVVNESDSKWFQGPWGFCLKEPEKLEFKQVKGHLGFFEVDYENI